jgi:hypothetical protein
MHRERFELSQRLDPRQFYGLLALPVATGAQYLSPPVAGRERGRIFITKLLCKNKKGRAICGQSSGAKMPRMKRTRSNSFRELAKVFTASCRSFRRLCLFQFLSGKFSSLPHLRRARGKIFRNVFSVIQLSNIR